MISEQAHLQQPGEANDFRTIYVVMQELTRAAAGSIYGSAYSIATNRKLWAHQPRRYRHR